MICHYQRTRKESDLTETIKILITFDRSFFTESIVVMRIRLPISPKKIKTMASRAPTNVACRVGSRRLFGPSASDACVQFAFVDQLAASRNAGSCIVSGGGGGGGGEGYALLCNDN